MTRLAWYTGILILGLIAIATQLDIASRHDGRLAPYVPGPFRNYAQVDIVETALAGQDADRALAEARTLVQRRPIPTNSLFLLASAYQRTGDQQAATLAFIQSTGRGWRHPVVEQIMVTTALQNADPAIAAAHLLALWSIDFDNPARDRLTHEVLAAPGGAEAYGEVVATSHFMQNAALRGAYADATPQDFARMVHAAIGAGAHFDCRLLTIQGKDLTRRGHAAEAALLATPECKEAG